jgi:hypothetical protein
MKSSRLVDLANLTLGALVTTLCGLVWGREGTVGAGVATMLACVNLGVMRRLAGRAVRRAAQGDKGQASWLIAAMAAKMMVLFALIWVALRIFHLALVPFAIGISVLPISLVFSGLWLSAAAGNQESA